MNSFASTKQDANKSSRSTSVAVANDAAHAEGQFIDNRDEPLSLAKLQKANPNTPVQRAAVSRPLQLASGKAEEVAPIFEEDEATPMTSEELADVKGPKGEGEQIERGEAELTRTARVKGFFGNESTYSKFLSKVDAFNASQDVIKKQEILVELRSLARLWLHKHKEDVESNKDQNERQKLLTVNSFLKRTNSNYPEITQLYDNLENKITGFRANPIAKKEQFQSAVSDYKFLQSKVGQYKKEYPPSVNLMYVAEIQGIEELEAKIQAIGKGEKEAPDFDPKPPFPALPFSIKSPTVGFSVMDATYGFKGALSFDIGNISSSSGEVSVNFNLDGSFRDVAIANGRFTANIDGMDFVAEGITYNSEDGSIIVNTATSNITMFEKTAKLTIEDGKIDNNEFTFLRIVSELPDASVGYFTVKNPVISYETEGKVFKGKADYEFSAGATPGELTSLSATGEGKADILWSREVETDRWVEIRDGVLDFRLLGQVVHADKMTFSSRGGNPTLAAEKASLDLNIPVPGSAKPLSQKIDGEGISISKNNGFTFDSLQAEREVTMGSELFSLTAKSVALKKDAGKYLAEAAGDVQFDKLGALGISADGAASGSVMIPLQAPHTPDYKITEASATATMPNPLGTDLAKLLGGRYSVDANVPVFPFVFATFGMFVETKAELPPSFSVSFNFDADKQDLIITASHEPATAQVEAGVDAGVKAGLPPLASLKIALAAAGKIAAKARAKFKKTFNLGKKEKPKAEDKTDRKSLEFGLNGRVTLGAALELTASALYFFKTKKKFDLGEKTLGEFELSNIAGKPKKEITPAPAPLGEEEALKSAIPGNDAETRRLKKLKGKQFIDEFAYEGSEPPKKKKGMFSRLFGR
jgi:hypothetical protein